MTIKECWVEALFQEGIPRKEALLAANPPLDYNPEVPADIQQKAIYDLRKLFRQCDSMDEGELIKQFLVKVGHIIQRIDASKN